MTKSPLSEPNNSKAILLAVAAIFCFSCMDVSVKAISPITGTMPALWARYTMQMLLVLLFLAPRLRQVVRTRYLKQQIARSLLLMLATFFFFMALGRIGLAEATAVMSLNPVLITLGGAIFLGEALGRRRIAAIAAAMLGAMIVIRPGSDVFSPVALLPLIAAICFAAYTLITRRIGPDEDVRTSLFYTGLIGTAVLSLIVPFYWQPVTWSAAGLMVLIGLFGATGQLLLIRALSMAQAGLLAPFNYSGLVFSIGFGLVLFAEVPGNWTNLGALVIVGAGLYVWHRETRVARKAIAPSYITQGAMADPDTKSDIPVRERVGHYISNLMIRSLIGAALMLPYTMRVRMLGAAVAYVVGPLVGYRRRAMTHLQHVFPDMDLNERKRIATASLNNTGRTFIENYSNAEMMARMQSQPITGDGLAALEQAERDGRPVLMVSGHFGNYETTRAALNARGYKVGGLYRDMANPYFNAHYVKTLEDLGGPMFPKGRGGNKRFVKHLRSGGQVGFLFDQHVFNAPVLDFVGKPARTTVSPAELALRYNAVLIPFYGIRQPDGISFETVLEAPIDHSDPLTMTQAMNDSLSARIRANPGQWLWVHRRWRPDQI